MRQMQFVTSDQAREGDNVADSLQQAREQAPWAAEIIEVEGGFIAFESAEDAETWCQQA